MTEKRFIHPLRKTYQSLYHEYESWQYAEYKPDGMDICIDKIIDAMHEVEDLIRLAEQNYKP